MLFEILVLQATASHEPKGSGYVFVSSSQDQSKSKKVEPGSGFHKIKIKNYLELIRGNAGFFKDSTLPIVNIDDIPYYALKLEPRSGVNYLTFAERETVDTLLKPYHKYLMGAKAFYSALDHHTSIAATVPTYDDKKQKIDTILNENGYLLVRAENVNDSVQGKSTKYANPKTEELEQTAAQTRIGGIEEGPLTVVIHKGKPYEIGLSESQFIKNMLSRKVKSLS